jgi:hypothetical protein
VILLKYLLSKLSFGLLFRDAVSPESDEWLDSGEQEQGKLTVSLTHADDDDLRGPRG